ncbi:MAG: glycosyltransferase [Chthoniobacterales bacterium]
MSFSIVYIVISNGRDEHADMALASMLSTKISNPLIRISLLCDENSAKSIKNNKHRILKVCDELIPVTVPDGDGTFKNRWIKTQLPKFIQGDALYLDSDTLVRLPLNKLPDLVEELGMVANHNGVKIYEQFWHEDRKIFTKMGWSTPYIQTYYNGGVLFFKHCSRTIYFFEQWHKFWCESTDKTGRLRDQPSLNQAIYSSNVKCEELPSSYNAQIPSDWIKSHNAVIWHFFSSSHDKSKTIFDHILSAIPRSSLDSLKHLIGEVLQRTEPWKNGDWISCAILRELTETRRPTIPETHWLNGCKLKAIIYYIICKSECVLGYIFFKSNISKKCGFTSKEEPIKLLKKQFRIVVSSPTFELSGANVFLAKLLDQLHQYGVESDWVITHHSPNDIHPWLGNHKFKVHKLPNTNVKEVRRRQEILLEFLNSRQPCVYIPNYDADMVCITPALPDEVKSVLILHSDEAFYYSLAREYGSYFDKIVVVSCAIYNKLINSVYTLKEKTCQLSYGVDHVSKNHRIQRVPSLPLTVTYCGRISKIQKRIHDLVAIINRSDQECLPIEYHIAGTGLDEEEFFNLVSIPLSKGKVVNHGFLSNDETRKLLDHSDVFIMTSDYEGQSIALLEAMMRGCVPVVTAIDSGVDELIIHGSTGFMVPVGDIEGFMGVIRTLSEDLSKVIKLSENISDFMANGKYRIDRAALEYKSLFESLFDKPKKYQARGSKKIQLPKHYKLLNRLKKRFFGDENHKKI